jgi:murein DD-endopeptidase MepM/ murein hydrolase activator NlpD
MTRSTVLIVTPTRTRSLQIDTRALAWLKPLLIGLSVSTVLLATGLAAIGHKYLAEGASNRLEIGKLRQEVTDLRNLTSAEISAKLAALKKSEQMIADLQTYLRARGVNVKPVTIEPPPGQPNPAAGGPMVRAARPVPFTGSFARDAENLLQAVADTPLGLPHGGPLTSAFAGRPNPFTGQGSEFHGGLDFKGGIGEPVHVTAQGKVSFAGWRGGYGWVVEVRHANGYATLYGHLSRINVAAGQQLSAGDTVGLIGTSGRSTGPHLHYEVQLQGNRLNPEQFLALNTPLGIIP